MRCQPTDQKVCDSITLSAQRELECSIESGSRFAQTSVRSPTNRLPATSCFPALDGCTYLELTAEIREESAPFV